jgi:hypothetical protein
MRIPPDRMMKKIYLLLIQSLCNPIRREYCPFSGGINPHGFKKAARAVHGFPHTPRKQIVSA